MSKKDGKNTSPFNGGKTSANFPHPSLCTEVRIALLGISLPLLFPLFSAGNNSNPLLPSQAERDVSRFAGVQFCLQPAPGLRAKDQACLCLSQRIKINSIISYAQQFPCVLYFIFEVKS